LRRASGFVLGGFRAYEPVEAFAKDQPARAELHRFDLSRPDELMKFGIADARIIARFRHAKNAPLGKGNFLCHWKPQLLELARRLLAEGTGNLNCLNWQAEVIRYNSPIIKKSSVRLIQYKNSLYKRVRDKTVRAGGPANGGPLHSFSRAMVFFRLTHFSERVPGKLSMTLLSSPRRSGLANWTSTSAR
jgi:hypothetical protein